MAANKIFNFGPVALSATLTTNILNPPTATGGVNAGSSGNYIMINHFRVLNKTGGGIAISLWKGASAGNVAGTEIVWSGVTVPANSFLDAYGKWRFDVADFLVGGAASAPGLVLEGEGEIGVAG